MHVLHEPLHVLAGDLAVDHADRPLLGAPVRQRLGYPQVTTLRTRGHRGLGVLDARRLQHPVEKAVARHGIRAPGTGIAAGVPALIAVRLVVGERRVHLLQRVGLVVVPVRAAGADPGVADPAALVDRVLPGVPGHPVGAHGEQLVLVGHFLRPGLLDDRGAAGGKHQQARGEPVQPPVVGVPVQQQVDQAGLPEQLVEVVGVGQVLVVGDRLAHRVVVHGGESQPALIPVPGEPIGEPAQLMLPDPAVVVRVTVALGHGGVQPGDDHREIGHLEQRPGLVRGEAHPVNALVESLECGGEVFPFRPVRCHRLALIRFLPQEVGLAGVAVDVVIAGYQGHVPAG